MIEAHGLTRRFGDTVALDDVGFTVARGEVVGLLGPNGAGKTTAMRILTCTLPPSAGRASVAGCDVVAQSLDVRRRVGFMPEHVPLYPDATVREHLRFTAEMKGVPATGRDDHLDAVMARAGLDEVRSRTVGNLSKGFRQRVGLAQALVGDPEVLILDEPTSGLDPHQIVEIRDLINGLRGERTVLLSSHILGEVARTCGRVLILDRGRLAAEVDADQLTDGADGRSGALEDLFLRLTGGDREPPP
jgi:ABC-2 type transport system ATP-binding protein